ncbi:kynureninase [Actinoplanes friuliensis]|uniref:Kynureninase n=1 Tax=Actinoplanes friuliensis DSM 7358 TaxID=1246995 RepID=U5W6U9_9ACTN|nr:kynureninase [Actinoplanes friuliensis]AGZ44874.1 putative kynureninase [Actinoplanes friuliensis DSM 7358]
MTDDLLKRAEALDAADPLAHLRERFLTPDGFDVVSYLDGNSLGRPLQATAQLLDSFVREQWAGRLIRGWTDGWMEWPLQLGDRLGAVALGAAAGQVVVADSTTVLLYKLSRAAVDARPGRRKIVLDTDNFPTDRYVLEGIAAERGLSLTWIETDPATGIRPEQVAEVVDEDTALVLFSHVAYRSGWLADTAEINRIAHAAGALTLWDLSHSVGSVDVHLDEWGADLAVGCTYKYLNGGPGAPAFAYLRRELQGELRQPIQGWMGHRASFEMGPGHEPAEGARALLSGTPPILAMVPLHANLDLLAEAGIEAVRAKSVLLTGYVLDLADEWLAPLGVEVVSPRDAARRGGHVTLRRPGFEQLLESLWDNGVIPDYRRPDGIRVGPAPLSTSFAEVHRGLSVLRALLEKQP